MKLEVELFKYCFMAHDFAKQVPQFLTYLRKLKY